MLRIGRIDYANCTPLFMQLEDKLPGETTAIVHGVPATLNARLAKGEIDICISSSIEFSRHADDYAILPGHCIGSVGAVKSVLLFTNRPVEELSGEQLLVTSESATSVILLQILLAKRWGLSGCSLQTSSMTWQEALQQSPGLLLIGDRALQAASDRAAVHCYDLGQEWKDLTGLPFVFALWLINRTSARGKERALTHFSRLLEQARERIEPDAELLAARAPESAWVGVQPLAEYWRHAITYQLDAAHLAGLERFYAFAAELGLIPAAPQPVFYPL
ncbi:menaquinone biosynthesis protein [Trichlorobacter lovleyi]|uniref:menaquinone biosynthesis protein n=1 Tax=Trichlorobacter lovleyi TaxID=313985 RepID=UPI002480E196|nr:menaquinone biosynthesis protein [Trichlorobacter lovleyi]